MKESIVGKKARTTSRVGEKKNNMAKQQQFSYVKLFSFILYVSRLRLSFLSRLNSNCFEYFHVFAVLLMFFDNILRPFFLILRDGKSSKNHDFMQNQSNFCHIFVIQNYTITYLLYLTTWQVFIVFVKPC